MYIVKSVAVEYALFQAKILGGMNDWINTINWVFVPLKVVAVVSEIMSGYFYTR